MTAELWLCTTDTDPDPLNLLDRVSYRLPRSFQGGMASGTFSLAMDGATRTLILPIICIGPNPAAAYQRLYEKLYEAPLGAGPWGMASANVVVVYKFGGETGYSYIDVVDAPEPVALELYGVGGYQAHAVTLKCLPWARGETRTFTGSIAAGGNAVWIDGVPGDRPAAARIQFTDTSGGGAVINGIILGRHDHPLLVSGDLNPYIAPAAQSPGVSQVDATAYNGHRMRLTPTTAAWQAVCRASGPTTGRMNRRGIVLAKVRDSAAVLGLTSQAALSVSAVTQGGGYLTTGAYTAFLVPKNGTNYGQPTGQVTAQVANLTPGGTEQVATSILFYDRDGTGDFRYWSMVDPAAVASATHTDWDGVSSKMFNLTPATNTAATGSGTNFYALGTTGAGLSGIDLPKVPASGILSARVRFKMNSASTGGGASSTVTLPYITMSLDATNSNVNAAAGLFGGSNGAVSIIELVALSHSYGLSTNMSFLNDSAWHVLEITYDITGVAQRVTVSLDGLPYVTNMAALPATTAPGYLLFGGGTNPGSLWIGEIVVADQYLGNTLAVASGSSITYGLVHASGEGSGYADLFVQQGSASGWYKVSSIGNVSTYTLSQWPPPSGTLQAYPVITPVVPTQIRAKAGLQATTPTFYPGQPRTPRLCNSNWEWVDLGGFSLPPLPIRQGGTPEPWVLEFEGMNPGGGTTFDIDTVVILDEMRGRTELSAPSNAAQRVWDSDTRADGLPGCVLRSKVDGSTQGQAAVTAPFHIGKGGCYLVPILQMQDGNNNQIADAVNATADVSITVVPMFSLSQGI